VTLERGKGKHRKFFPHVFTEQGVSMLSAVLRGDIAVKVSIQIMQAFVAMRKTLGQLHGVIQRLEGVEIQQLKTDSKLEQLLKALEKGQPTKRVVFPSTEEQQRCRHLPYRSLDKTCNVNPR
jgi:hypothetical protein